jgi:adenylate kinase
MRLLLLAGPGAGKGTQGALLADRLGIPHVSSGEVLRQQAAGSGPLAREIAGYQQRGDLVPDHLVIDALTPVLVAAAAAGGYILDGFPRTVAQASAAAAQPGDRRLVFDAVVHLVVPRTVLVRRLLDRAQREGRADDTETVIRHRLDVFDRQTTPLPGYYRQRSVVVAVEGDQPPGRVVDEILARLSEVSLTGGPR